MGTRQSARLGVAVLAVAGVCAAGCGSSDDEDSAKAGTVDASKVENGITKAFSSDGAEVTKVGCPENVETKKGDTFKCDVTWSNDATGKVQVTQEGGAQFSSEVVAGSVQVPGKSVDKALEKELERQGAPNATADCPQTIAVKVGSTVTCDLNSAGGGATGEVTFTFESATGEVEASSVQTG